MGKLHWMIVMLLPLFWHQILRERIQHRKSFISFLSIHIHILDFNDLPAFLLDFNDLPAFLSLNFLPKILHKNFFLFFVYREEEEVFANSFTSIQSKWKMLIKDVEQKGRKRLAFTSDSKRHFCSVNFLFAPLFLTFVHPI
jgi:hypothetical protein